MPTFIDAVREYLGISTTSFDPYWTDERVKERFTSLPVEDAVEFAEWFYNHGWNDRSED